MTDYGLSKFFFEMKEPALRDAFSAEPEATLDRFHVTGDARRAVLERDVAKLAQKVNPYLLRYFCGYIGMPEDEFLAKIRTADISALDCTRG